MDLAVNPVQVRQGRFKLILLVAVLLGFTVFFLVLAWVVTYGGGISFKTNGLLGVHMTYMVFYLLIIHPLSSTIYRLLSTTIKYNVQILHAGIHLIALIGTSVGLGAIIFLHSQQVPAHHFYSLHSWLGITAFSIYVMQFIAGLLIFIFEIPSKTAQEWVLPVHRATGQLLITLTAGSVLTGLFNAAIFDKNLAADSLVPEILLNFAALLVIAYTFAIGYLLTDYFFRRPVYPEMERLLSRSELASVYSASGMQPGTKEKGIYSSSLH